MKKHVDVVCAILINEKNEILCTKRKNIGELANKWEFPGGKIEIGESLENALIREINEELLIRISSPVHFHTTYYEYQSFTITLHAFISKLINTSYTLVDHADARWLSINEITTLDWADADRPIVEKLILEEINEVLCCLSKSNI